MINDKKSDIYIRLFSLLSGILFFIFFIGLLRNPYGAQRNIFFAGMGDLFADFFNVLRYISERDPYFNQINGLGEKGYLPLSYLILYPFSQLDNFNGMTLSETWNSKIGIIFVFLFTMFSVFLLLFSLNQIRKKYTLSPILFISIILSYIFFFSIERGNLIIISSALVVFFINWYDSDHKYERILAVICLALAVTLKLYPVLFGFLYLEKKQYREIFLSAIITLLLTFIPFLFFKRGFSNIPQLLENVKLNTVNYSFSYSYPRFSFAHVVFAGLSFLNFNEGMIKLFSNIAQIITNIAVIISIVLCCISKNKWLKVSLLTMAVVFLPVNSGWYCGLYLFPMIVLFFATLGERSTVFNVYIFIVFIIFLNPFQIAIPYKDYFFILNYIIGNIALLSLWLVLLIYSGREIIVYQLQDLKLK